MDINDTIENAEDHLQDVAQDLFEVGSALDESREFIQELRDTNTLLRKRGDQWKASALNAFEDRHKAWAVNKFLEEQNEELRAANAGLNKSLDEVLEKLAKIGSRIQKYESKAIMTDREIDDDAYVARVKRQTAFSLADKLVQDGVVTFETYTRPTHIDCAYRDETVTIAQIEVLT
jgi:chromosome segregation ATPase